MSRWLARIVWHVVPHGLLAWLDGWRVAILDRAPAVLSQVPSHSLRLAGYRALGAKVGRHTSIHRGCRFYRIDRLVIGDHSVVNMDVILDARSGLSIGRNVSISEQAAIYTLQHDLDDPHFGTTGAPVVIEDYVFIGARAIVLPGVRLGKGAAVAAGAVVTREVAPGTVVGGVPARPIRRRAQDLQYTLDYRRSLH